MTEAMPRKVSFEKRKLKKKRSPQLGHRELINLLFFTGYVEFIFKVDVWNAPQHEGFAALLFQGAPTLLKGILSGIIQEGGLHTGWCAEKG